MEDVELSEIEKSKLRMLRTIADARGEIVEVSETELRILDKNTREEKLTLPRDRLATLGEKVFIIQSTSEQ